jgi:succinyl-CoA synthetase beta subunit
VIEDSISVGIQAKRMNPPMVVKAQVHSGGRWKNGAIRFVRTLQDADTVAAGLLGLDVSLQSKRRLGKTDPKRFDQEALKVDSEKYVSIVLDHKSAKPVLLASPGAGVEVETARPFEFFPSFADGAWNLSDATVHEAVRKLALPESLMHEGVLLIRNLWNLFFEKECVLLEINPLAVTPDGGLVALDAKIEFDDNALFRHSGLCFQRDTAQEGVVRVGMNRIPFVRLGGSIGLMVNGAGLAMATLDGLRFHGGEPANFLDIGGGVTADDVDLAMDLLSGDKRIRTILIQLFGGIVKCDLVAEGLVRALRRRRTSVPFVLRFEGANRPRGWKFLKGPDIVLL